MDKFKANLELIFEADGFEGKIYSMIKQQLQKEGGHLKSLLGSGELTLDEIINAIKNERCIRSIDRDLGSTYLSQMVGTAIRKIVPTDYINQARLLFGLPKLSKKEIKKKEYTQLDKEREAARRR